MSSDGEERAALPTRSRSATEPKQLPQDLLERVIRKLSLTSLETFRTVSKHWRMKFRNFNPVLFPTQGKVSMSDTLCLKAGFSSSASFTRKAKWWGTLWFTIRSR